MMYAILKGTQMVSPLIEWVMSSKYFIFTRLTEIKSGKYCLFPPLFGFLIHPSEHTGTYTAAERREESNSIIWFSEFFKPKVVISSCYRNALSALEAIYKAENISICATRS